MRQSVFANLPAVLRKDLQKTSPRLAASGGDNCVVPPQFSSPRPLSFLPVVCASCVRYCTLRLFYSSWAFCRWLTTPPAPPACPVIARRRATPVPPRLACHGLSNPAGILAIKKTAAENSRRFWCDARFTQSYLCFYPQRSFRLRHQGKHLQPEQLRRKRALHH